MATLTGVSPVLLVADLDRSVTYYRDQLGLHVEAYGDPPNFATADRDMEVAEALVEVIRSAGGTERARVTVSAGVATFADVTVTADEVLVRADRAMYEAKAAGRDGHAVHGRPRRRSAA